MLRRPVPASRSLLGPSRARACVGLFTGSLRVPSSGTLNRRRWGRGAWSKRARVFGRGSSEGSGLWFPRHFCCRRPPAPLGPVPQDASPTLTEALPPPLAVGRYIASVSKAYFPRGQRGRERAIFYAGVRAQGTSSGRGLGGRGGSVSGQSGGSGRAGRVRLRRRRLSRPPPRRARKGACVPPPVATRPGSRGPATRPGWGEGGARGVRDSRSGDRIRGAGVTGPAVRGADAARGVPGRLSRPSTAPLHPRPSPDALAWRVRRTLPGGRASGPPPGRRARGTASGTRRRQRKTRPFSGRARGSR